MDIPETVSFPARIKQFLLFWNHSPSQYTILTIYQVSSTYGKENTIKIISCSIVSAISFKILDWEPMYMGVDIEL